MASAQHLIKKMFEILEAQKRDINQLYLVTQHAVTDIYRANSYAAQLEGILSKIGSLLVIYESLKSIEDMTDKEAKEYAQLLNSIATELKFLKATSEAMDDTIKKVRDSGDIEHRISGNIVHLKKQVNKTLKKMEQIISTNQTIF